MDALLFSTSVVFMMCAFTLNVQGMSQVEKGPKEETSEDSLLFNEDYEKHDRGDGKIFEDDGDLGHAQRRVKRTSFNITQHLWPHRIPYVISFSSPTRRYRIRKVLDELEDQLCVKFFNEDARLNESNPNWTRDIGYDSNTYIHYHNGGGCWSVMGQGGKNTKGPRANSPCYSYLTIFHETLHTLGGLHTQKFHLRDKYLTVHMANIKSQYGKAPQGGKVNSGFFDPASYLMYSNRDFGTKGPTYDLVRPEMGHLSEIKSAKTIMYEMTQNYKCAETFCNGVSKDCGSGYLTFLHDECVCTCPDQYDPDTNCTTLKATGTKSPVSWPNTPFTLYRAGDRCPEGFSTGTIPLPGEMEREQTGVPLLIEGQILNIEVCMRSTPTENIDWLEWPIGTYCIGKVAGVSCSLPFKETTFKMKTTGPKPLVGDVGDVTIDGAYVIMKFCCTKHESARKPLLLPTSQPFRLLMAKAVCQEVEGMFAVPTTITTETKTTILGYKPTHEIKGSYFTHHSCLYIPPVYGCNQIFTLSADHRTVTFSIPTKHSLREGSRRCFYAFQAPNESRLRLTFDKFNIHPDDKFYVKRFHPWTNHYRVLADSRPTQMITERNYLFVEFWSHFEEATQYIGADLTVDLLLDKEMCYTPETKGADYAGDKSVTELYEECVAWKDATSCPDFPWKYSLTLFNISNKCRNLDTLDMLQPWCYTHVDGEVCVRRYCDVCNEAKIKDVVLGCQEMMSDNPNACHDPFFRNSCFKSCGAPIHLYNRDDVRISKMKSPAQRDPEQLCYDESELCQNALAVFPAFCIHGKSSEIASQYCAKSCGLCEAGTCSISDGPTYTVVSPSGGEVTTGQTVTLACFEGLTHALGDLNRTCSLTGELLGVEPLCQERNIPVNINMNGIREWFRTDTFLAGTAVLLLSHEFRVPFGGNITQWFYYCRNDEDIHLVVYRNESSLSKDHYELVGSNPATCVRGRPWTHWVPQEQQVIVKQGDVIGVYQPTSSFGTTGCGAPNTWVVTTKGLSASTLLDSSTASFPKKKCFRIAVGARVEPLP